MTEDDEIYLRYPDQVDVNEHLFHLEYAHPGRWLHFMDWLVDNASLGHMQLSRQEYLDLMSVGIIRPVFVETTDDEEFYFQKVWSFTDHRYKEVGELDDDEIPTLSMFSDRVYARN